MRFCRSAVEDLQIGDWVELNGPEGSEAARIVFAPGQVEYQDPPTDLPRIHRRLSRDEIAGLTYVALSDDHPSARFGSLGRFHPRMTDLDAHIRARLRIDQTPDLPHLGAIVQTGHGPGVLLGISMRHQSATIRLGSGEEIRVPIGELG